tara:strand:+ start:79 stop:615 length:537 start_codon:yes stop_codon:yes gene_type:complete
MFVYLVTQTFLIFFLEVISMANSKPNNFYNQLATVSAADKKMIAEAEANPITLAEARELDFNGDAKFTKVNGEWVRGVPENSIGLMVTDFDEIKQPNAKPTWVIELQLFILLVDGKPRKLTEAEGVATQVGYDYTSYVGKFLDLFRDEINNGQYVEGLWPNMKPALRRTRKIGTYPAS